MSLRPFTTGDVEAVTRAHDDPDIRLWNPSPKVDGDWAAWVEHRLDWSDQAHASWAIAAPDDSLVGSISLHHVEYDTRDGEIGYWVAPWARRQGYGLRALLLAMGFAFGVVQLHRVELFHAVENTASCAMATKAGLRLEGTLLESYRYGDGEFHDEHMHAILRREWSG
jgi:RimJ/RimL family protein N-acetyltransferase